MHYGLGYVPWRMGQLRARLHIDWCGACAALMAVVQPPRAHGSEGPKLVQHEPLLALDTLLQRYPTVANTAGASTPELVR